jgi:FdhE protein
MQRILQPGQIESFAQRTIPRVRLPVRTDLFSRRARRLRELSANEAIGHSIGDYLQLMAAVADAQQAALARFTTPLSPAAHREQARTHRMPPIHATGFERDSRWTEVLAQLCDSIIVSGFPPGVGEVCERLLQLPREQMNAYADALLAAQPSDFDLAGAPFVMAALQVYWLDLASQFEVEDVAPLDVPGVCPMCGTLPVASVVRADHGHRYLHCALCATEWHMVRVTCSHCQSAKGVTYHSIDGISEAIRAETCEACHVYLKILYQEKDASVEPVADDLASLALDLLMSEAGYHRGNSNPLLWQRS